MNRNPSIALEPVDMSPDEIRQTIRNYQSSALNLRKAAERHADTNPDHARSQEAEAAVLDAEVVKLQKDLVNAEKKEAKKASA